MSKAGSSRTSVQDISSAFVCSEGVLTFEASLGRDLNVVHAQGSEEGKESD